VDEIYDEMGKCIFGQSHIVKGEWNELHLYVGGSAQMLNPLVHHSFGVQALPTLMVYTCSIGSVEFLLPVDEWQSDSVG